VPPAVQRLKDRLARKGAFYRPTFLEVTDSRMPIVQEEVFGPVLTMQVFDTEREAVALANDSEYGLAASIWTRDVDRPLRIARELQVGTVWVNDWVMMRDEFEEGGHKQSGRGRLRGLAALDDFLEYKHIVLNPGIVGSRESGDSNESERSRNAPKWSRDVDGMNEV
jgi:betaine-aldehyde dehydrogenase